MFMDETGREKDDSPQKTQNDKRHKEKKSYVFFVVLCFLWLKKLELGK